MAKLVRNVPSEASLECPVCGKKYKIRTTKKHINDVHKLSITYTCVFPLADGEVCGFTCGKRISCFNNHQTRRHNVNFTELSEHKYDESTYFVLGIGEAGEDLHTPKCTEETKFFSAETMKEVRKRHRAKTGTSKIVVDEEKVDEPEAEVKKNSKRKAESDVSAKGAKKAKKEKLVKNTHTKSPLPQANDAEGSIPLVENDVIIEVVDLPNDIEVIIEVVEPTEEDVGGVVKPETELNAGSSIPKRKPESPNIIAEIVHQKESQKSSVISHSKPTSQDVVESNEIELQLCPNLQFGCKELVEPELAEGHYLLCAFPPYTEDEIKITMEGTIHLNIVPHKIGSKIVFNASLHERGILFCLTKNEMFTTFEVVKFKDVLTGFNETKSKFIIRFISSDPTAMLLMQPIQVGLRDDAEVLNHILAGYVKVNIEVIKSN